MAQSVFFSWQADTPNRVGRTFLREVLEEVCAVIAADTTLDEAARDLAVDSDTQGVAGQPPIAETIFKKIDASAVFVADMTFTGKRMDGRPTPNANVLIEYGWALKSLGHEHVICVMNAAYGPPTREDLPFDLAHLRWPITYSLAEDGPAEVKREEKRKLAKTLEAALRASLGTVPTPLVAEPPPFPQAAAKDGPARFRAPGEALGFEDDSFGGSNRKVYLAAGPAIWLRLFPSVNPARRWTTREIKERAVQGDAGLLMPMVSGAGGYSHLRAEDGLGMHRAEPIQRMDDPPESIQVAGVTFVFRTGEAWSVDTALLAYETTRLFSDEIEKVLSESAERYRRFQATLGITGVLKWKTGVVGAQGRRLAYPPAPNHVWLGSAGPTCAADVIEAEGLLSPGQSARSALLPFFERLFEECGVERPDYLPR